MNLTLRPRLQRSCCPMEIDQCHHIGPVPHIGQYPYHTKFLRQSAGRPGSLFGEGRSKTSRGKCLVGRSFLQIKTPHDASNSCAQPDSHTQIRGHIPGARASLTLCTPSAATPCPRKALHLGWAQPIGFVPLSLGTELCFRCCKRPCFSDQSKWGYV